MSLADVIRRSRERIIARFVHDVEISLSPGGLTRSMLVDHIPVFLEDVARELDTAAAVRAGQSASDASATAREHGEQRWSLGFDLESVIREYGMLSRCILAEARESGSPPDIDEHDVLAKCLNVGLAEAASAYTRHRNSDVAAQRARVEAATRAKDELLLMITHELRTPLHAILGWLRLMRSGTLDEVRRQHAIEVIARNAEAQDRLVADLVDMTRVITGKLPITLGQVDLSDIVDMAIEAVRPAADAKKIRLDVAPEHRRAVVRGDADRLQQVVWNLVANAVKFTPKSGVVQVRLRRIESDIELTVEDNGEGIEPAFLPHVFEIFQQSDRSSSRAHGGLGIGLSIVKHIVDLHGGSIRARSVGKGSGATFSLRIPISPLTSSPRGDVLVCT